VVHTIVKSPFTVNVSVETWLGFALQFLEYTYTRTDLEGIIHCWAILEALFTHPNETTSIDQRNHYRGTSEKIAIRALILEAPKDTRSQQNFYNKVRQVADTRNLLAHGKTRGTRKVLPPQLGEVRDTVRRCLLNVIQWVANNGNEASESCHGNMLQHLDAQRSAVLKKRQEQYLSDYKTS
jgi:hypothetical protein